MKHSLPIKGCSALSRVSRQVTWLTKWFLQRFHRTKLPVELNTYNLVLNQQLSDAVTSYNNAVYKLQDQIRLSYEQYRQEELARRAKLKAEQEQIKRDFNGS